jgi:hypothetical protein
MYGARYDVPLDTDSRTVKWLHLAVDCARGDCVQISEGILSASLMLSNNRKLAAQRLRAWSLMLAALVRRLDEASAYEAGAADALDGLTPARLQMEQHFARLSRKVAIGRAPQRYDCGEHGMLTIEEIGLRIDRTPGTVYRLLRDGRTLDEIMARAPRRRTPRAQHSLRA